MRQLFDTLLMTFGVLLLTLATRTAQSGVAHDEWESHERIREAARQHVLDRAEHFRGKVTVSTSPLDSRLRLARCDQPLEAYDAPNGLKPGRNVVGVRCTGRKPWKLFVRVNITTREAVVVTARPLARGQQVVADDLRIEERDTSRMQRAYYTDPKPLIGLRARRQIGAGQPLHPGLVEQRRLVRRGALVQIVARHGELQVTMKGKALESGVLGDLIRVRNTASGREISGEVVAAGVVEVRR